MIETFPVMVKHIPAVWPWVWKFIEAALKRGVGPKPSLLEVYTKIWNKELQLWVVWKNKEIVAAGLTEVAIEGSRKVCWIYAAGGNAKEAFHSTFSRVVDWARINGCFSIRIRGRKGWKRIFKDMVEIEPGILEKKL